MSFVVRHCEQTPEDLLGDGLHKKRSPMRGIWPPAACRVLHLYRSVESQDRTRPQNQLPRAFVSLGF